MREAERHNLMLRDLEADLDRCKRSLLSAVTERDEARAEIVRLNQQIVDRDTTIMLEGETIERLRSALAEVMVPIEVLTAPGDKAWELAPEVRGELMTARTLGRAALTG